MGRVGLNDHDRENWIGLDCMTMMYQFQGPIPWLLSRAKLLTSWPLVSQIQFNIQKHVLDIVYR
jgi:hypothetical protein